MLDLYSLPYDTIVDIVRKLGNSSFFWLPYQVETEFKENYKRVRNGVENRYKNSLRPLMDKLNESKESLKYAKASYDEKNIIETETLFMEIEENIDNMVKNIKENIHKFKSMNRTDKNCISASNDIIEGLVNKLANENNSKKFTVYELLKIYEEGELRNKYKFPPGITDIEKDNEIIQTGKYLKKYGDLILWKEILRKVSKEKKNLIFVQNETKDDWWDTNDITGERVPSKILVDEFTSSAILENPEFKMMNFEEFIKTYGEFLSIDRAIISIFSQIIDVKEEVFNYFDKYTDDALNREDLISLSNSLEMFRGRFEFTNYMGGLVEDVESVKLKDIEVIKTSKITLNDSYEYMTRISAKCEVGASARVSDFEYHEGKFVTEVEFNFYFALDILEDIDPNRKIHKNYRLKNCEIKELSIMPQIEESYKMVF